MRLTGVGEWFAGDAVAEGLELADSSCAGVGRSVCGVAVGAGVAVDIDFGGHVPGAGACPSFDI